MNDIERAFSHCDFSRVEHLDSVTKKNILDFFNTVKYDEIGASTMPIVDAFTGNQVTDYRIQNRVVPKAFYRKGQLIWTSELVYHFDRYNVMLDSELKKYAIDYMADRPTETGASFN